MSYSWAGYSIVKADAQVIGDHIESLRQERGGRLVPTDLVADATYDDSPLHDLFEWDDEVAAHEHRLNQARYIIRSIVVTVESSADAVPVRAFVSVVKDDERFYTHIEHAMTEEDLRSQVIAKAYKEMQDWCKRYKDLSEFASVFKAVDLVLV